MTEHDARETWISNYLCSAHPWPCKCDGDEDGADTERALCVRIARKLIALPEHKRRELALDIAPELSAENG